MFIEIWIIILYSGILMGLGCFIGILIEQYDWSLGPSNPPNPLGLRATGLWWSKSRREAKEVIREILRNRVAKEVTEQVLRDRERRKKEGEEKT